MAEEAIRDTTATGTAIPDGDRARTLAQLRAVGSGLTFNNADEFEAWVRSKFGEDYTTARNKIRSENESYSEKYPFESTAFNLAGAVLPTIMTGGLGLIPSAAGATGTLARIAASPTARAAVTGGVTGAASGFGEAKEMANVPGEMAGYGILGTGLGAATPAVTRTAGGILSTIKDYFSPNVEKKVGQLLQRSVKETGLTTQEIRDRLAKDRMIGVESSSLADTSDDLRALAVKLETRGKAGASELRNEAERTIDLQPRTVQQRLKKDLRAGDFYEDEARTVANLRASAPGMYDEVYKHGEILDPRVANLLEDIDFAEAFKVAKVVNKKLADTAIRNGEDPSRFQLKDIYKIVNNEDGSIKDFKVVSVPDLRTLDLVQRELDAKITGLYGGPGAKPTLAAATKKQREDLIKYMDEATTDPRTNISKYAQVRKTYGDEKEIINAFEMGKDKFKAMDPEEIKKYYDGISDAAKTAARTGVARDAYNNIDMAVRSGSSAAKAVSGDFIQAKYEPLFESTKKFDFFKAAMSREAELHDQAQSILNASVRSAGKRADLNLNEKAGAMGSILVQAGSGNWTSAARSLSNNVATAISNPGLTDGVAEKLTKLLLSKTPEDVGVALKVIENFSAKADKALMDKGRRELMAVSGFSAVAPKKGSGERPDDESSTLSDDDRKELRAIRSKRPILSDEDKEELMEIRNRMRPPETK